jgi:hypothetical protein
MGAALTYARRYALFTLVGIAGEDDIDAPDLNAPTPTPVSGLNQRTGNKNNKPNGGKSQVSPQQVQSDRDVGEHRTRAGQRFPPPVFDPQASSALRDRLAAELKTVGSAEEAASWAYRVLGTKSTLIAADAKQIEAMFERKLTEFEKPEGVNKRRKARSRESDQRNDSASIDKSDLSHPEPRRIRDREHVRFVIKQVCLICGRTPCDPHHLRFSQLRALGRKVSDEFTVPLCRGHHREVHRCGNEAGWWEKAGINPSAAARALWLKTHPVPTRPGMRSVESGGAEAPDEHASAASNAAGPPSPIAQ